MSALTEFPQGFAGLWRRLRHRPLCDPWRQPSSGTAPWMATALRASPWRERAGEPIPLRLASYN